MTVNALQNTLKIGRLQLIWFRHSSHIQDPPLLSYHLYLSIFLYPTNALNLTNPNHRKQTCEACINIRSFLLFISTPFFSSGQVPELCLYTWLLPPSPRPAIHLPETEIRRGAKLGLRRGSSCHQSRLCLRLGLDRVTGRGASSLGCPASCWFPSSSRMKLKRERNRRHTAYQPNGGRGVKGCVTLRIICVSTFLCLYTCVYISHEGCDAVFIFSLFLRHAQSHRSHHDSITSFY